MLVLITLKGEAAIRVKQKGVNVQTEESALYDCRGNGLAEAGVKAVKDKVRMVISATNASYGIKLREPSLNARPRAISWIDAEEAVRDIRKLFIKKSDLATHDHTEGCLVCQRSTCRRCQKK